MQQKQLLILAGVLVGLLGIAWIAGVFDRNPSSISVPELDIPVDEVTEITLIVSEDTLSLVRQATQWLVHSPVESEADSNTVGQFLRQLSLMQLDKLATSNPDRYGLYGIDGTGSEVHLTWPNGEETLVLARQGADYQSIYVRVGDDPNVYATTGRVNVTQDTDRWRKREVLRMDAGALASVNVVRPEGNYTVTRGRNTWMIDGIPLDSVQVTTWLRRFAPLNGDGFFDDLPPQVIMDASHRIDFVTDAGTTTSLHVMQHDDALAVAPGGGRFTYRLYESRREQLFPELSTLLGEN